MLKPVLVSQDNIHTLTSAKGMPVEKTMTSLVKLVRSVDFVLVMAECITKQEQQIRKRGENAEC